MTRARFGATIVGVCGIVITAVVQLWSLISQWQQIEQLYEDAPRFMKTLGHPLAGPGIAVAAVIAYGGIVAFERVAKKSAKPSLAGKYFHTIDSKGEIENQGGVLRDEDGRLFAQLFRFSDGRRSIQRYLTVAEVQTARFYDSAEQMRAAYIGANPELSQDLMDFAAQDFDDDD